MSAELQKIEDTTSAIPPEELEAFTAKLVAAMKTVYDPEIPVDIYELGLIYKVDVADNKDVTVDMTLTAPGCPVAGEMPDMVKAALETVEGIGTVTELLMRVLEAAKRASPTASQRGGDGFWDDATRQVLRYTIPALYAASASAALGAAAPPSPPAAAPSGE